MSETSHNKAESNISSALSWLILHHLWECFKLLLPSYFNSIAKTTLLAYSKHWIPKIVKNVQKSLIYILFSGGQSSSLHTEFKFWVCLVIIHDSYFFPIGKPRLQRRGRQCNHTSHEGLSWWWQECQNLSWFPNLGGWVSILPFRSFPLKLTKTIKSKQVAININKC